VDPGVLCHRDARSQLNELVGAARIGKKAFVTCFIARIKTSSPCLGTPLLVNLYHGRSERAIGRPGKTANAPGEKANLLRLHYAKSAVMPP
jgi:hypothetical protein